MAHRGTRGPTGWTQRDTVSELGASVGGVCELRALVWARGPLSVPRVPSCSVSPCCVGSALRPEPDPPWALCPSRALRLQAPALLPSPLSQLPPHPPAPQPRVRFPRALVGTRSVSEARPVVGVPGVTCAPPRSSGKITLHDLKRCKMANVFYDTFFNIEKYLEHEQKEQASLLRVRGAGGMGGAGELGVRCGAGQRGQRPVTRVCRRRPRVRAPSSRTGRNTPRRSTTSWWPRRLRASPGRTGEWGAGTHALLRVPAEQRPLLGGRALPTRLARGWLGCRFGARFPE